MNTFFLIGAAFALFFAVLLSGKKEKRLPDLVLSSWFLVIMLHLLACFTFSEKAYLEYPHLLGIDDSFPFLYGPFIFIYAVTLIARKPIFRKSYLLHFIPFVISNLVYLPFFLADGENKVELYFTRKLEILPLRENVLITFKLLSGPVYVTWVWLLLRKHCKNIQHYFSYTEEIDLKWLKRLTFWFGVFLMVVLTSFFAEQVIFPINSDFVINIAFSVFVIAFGYYGFKQGAIFTEVTRQDDYFVHEELSNANQQNEEEIATVKYEKSGLKEDDANKYLEMLLEYMEEEESYLNSELTIEDVANALDIPRHGLTQVINQKLGKNFYQFVNEYRVEESKRRIMDPQNQLLTLLAIGYDSGFNSKSSFNTIFKSFTNLTPSQFKKMNEGASLVDI